LKVFPLKPSGPADPEQGRIESDLLKIKIKLAKDPADYAVNNPNKKIRMLIGAKANYAMVANQARDWIGA
jgi:hypothetical protein